MPALFSTSVAWFGEDFQKTKPNHSSMDTPRMVSVSR